MSRMHPGKRHELVEAIKAGLRKHYNYDNVATLVKVTKKTQSSMSKILDPSKPLVKLDTFLDIIEAAFESDKTLRSNLISIYVQCKCCDPELIIGDAYAPTRKIELEKSLKEMVDELSGPEEIPRVSFDDAKAITAFLSSNKIGGFNRQSLVVDDKLRTFLDYGKCILETVPLEAENEHATAFMWSFRNTKPYEITLAVALTDGAILSMKHVHPDSLQWTFCLSGSVVVEHFSDGSEDIESTSDLMVGSGICIEAGRWHQIIGHKQGDATLSINIKNSNKVLGHNSL